MSNVCVGDVVHVANSDNLMTVVRIEERPLSLKAFVYCEWFDEKCKLRQLRFYKSDLIVVAHGVGFASG